MDYVVKLGSPDSVEPVTSDLEGWTVIDGTPSMKTWVLHTSADGQMISGYWEATPGTYRATYTEYEFVHFIEGKLTITPDGGAPVVLGPGDAFVIEAGFKGTWKIDETVRKHFLIQLAK
ncbi:MAG: cupin protein [Rhizobium sp.]|nr:cupin protein [Rhizobium sp.]